MRSGQRSFKVTLRAGVAPFCGPEFYLKKRAVLHITQPPALKLAHGLIRSVGRIIDGKVLALKRAKKGPKIGPQAYVQLYTERERAVEGRKQTKGTHVARDCCRLPPFLN